MKVRIGIDVGGTFTDGVAVSNEDFKVIGTVKVPTTHTHEHGVAMGIIQALRTLLEKHHIATEDIVFLAHGTTQATNALLEGDVTPVGIVATSTGLEGMRAKADSNIEDIELAPGKYIKVFHDFLDTKDLENKIKDSVQSLKDKGAEVIVAAEPYSVDNSRNERFIQNKALDLGLASTATHEISSLYGLKLRTRTAVINASILPKMIETSNMTERSVKEAGIGSQLMIMRCDGGVMGIDEVRSRPIMTLLSGPAAGVAGALMYEKISDGLFLEVGGTSTDISAIKNGEVMLKYAEVGGHKTYVNSLDVRTIGIAGGSMIKVKDNKIVDVGPRSAHIAGFNYEAFAEKNMIDEPVLRMTKENNESYVYIESQNGKKFALTLTGAANILQLIPKEGYSSGEYESSYKAYQALADVVGKSVEETAQEVMNIAVGKCVAVLEALIQEYELDRNIIELVGGGGGSGAIVPNIAKAMNIKSHLAKNSEVISTIGVALAMVREVVDRTILNPSEEDVLKIRKEAEEKIISSGANPKTVNIKIEIDKQNNLLRAIATGSSELKQKTLSREIKSQEELIDLASKSFGTNKKDIEVVSSTSSLFVFEHVEEIKKLFGLIKNKNRNLRVISNDGVVKLKLQNFDAVTTKMNNLMETLKRELSKRTFYTDGGEEVPSVYIGCGSRIIDLSGLINRDQIASMAKLEIVNYSPEEEAFILFGNK